MKRFLFPAILVSLTIIFVVSGCSKDADDDASNGLADAVGKDERSLIVAIPTDMTSQDIHNHNSSLTESVHTNMYNYLFKKEEDGEIVPELVDTFDNIDDLTWEFTLKEGITFHNGDELTADDVKFTLERVARDDSLREYSHYKQIEEVEVIDDYNFIIKTTDPEPILLNRLSRVGSSILPKDYIEKHGWEHFYEEPIGTGPFKFVEWKKDNEIVYEVYDDYYEGKVEDWDTLIFRVVPEDSTRVAELLTGGVDLALNMPDHEWDRIDNNDGTTTASTLSQRVIMYLLRVDDEYATSDIRVREAIDLAIDNEALTEGVLGGGGVPVRTRITPANTGANEDLYDTFNYDPERAKELLAEAGYADGLEITLHGANGQYTKDRDVQEMVAGMLAEVGITVNLDLMESSSLSELRSSDGYKEGFFVGYGNSQFDASLGLDNLRSERAMEYQGYKNEEFDALMDKAEKNMDADERVKQYQRAQEIIAEDLPYIYLYAEKVTYGINDSIEFTPRPDELINAKDLTKK